MRKLTMNLRWNTHYMIRNENMFFSKLKLERCSIANIFHCSLCCMLSQKRGQTPGRGETFPILPFRNVFFFPKVGPIAFIGGRNTEGSKASTNASLDTV